MTDSCKRCGDGIAGGSERFQVRAWDFTASTAAYIEGGLCASCWVDLIDFMQVDRPEGRCPIV